MKTEFEKIWEEIQNIRSQIMSLTIQLEKQGMCLAIAERKLKQEIEKTKGRGEGQSTTTTLKG